MTHAVLLGDSIFDNASYVAQGHAVIDALRVALPASWQATLIAVDGSTTSDVAMQLAGRPSDATHLLISCGGNDALGHLGILQARCTNVHEALGHLLPIVQDFRHRYQAMLACAKKTQLPIVVCTIYDAIPSLDPVTRFAVGLFNDVIVREAVAHDIDVMDLRTIVSEVADFASMSPIEPSAQGAQKLARALTNLLVLPGYLTKQTRVFSR